MIIFSFENSSTNFGCEKEIFAQIRFFPFTIFYSQSKRKTGCGRIFLKKFLNSKTKNILKKIFKKASS